MASEPASVRLPMTLGELLDYPRWKGDVLRGRMGIALEYLQSAVADTYVDWAVNRGILPQYRHGGSWQFHIWDPELRLRPVAARSGLYSCPLFAGHN